MPSKKELLSIPNIICYFRILLVPIFMYVYLTAETDAEYLMSAGILTLSGFSDFLDGYIARNFNMITDWGKMIDPLADKLTQVVCASLLVYTYPAYWVLLIIIVVKDVMLAVAGVYIYKKTGRKMNGAQLPGKIATAVFFVVSISLIAFHIPGSLISRVLIMVTAFLMFTAMVYYAKDLYHLYVQRD